MGGTADADLGAIGSPVQPTYYKYDLYGNMVQVTQGLQNRYFKYDSLGRLIRVRQPEQEVNTNIGLADGYNTSGQWTAGFTYDVLGNVLTATDAKHVTIANTYDRANRVTGRAYYGETGTATPPVYFFYDGTGLASQQSPNYAKGKLTRVYSSISETRYKLFDNFDRLKEMEQRTPEGTEAPENATARVSKYTYNFSGALIEEEYPSGRKVKNEFETDGDLKRIYGTATSSAAEQTYANSFSYTASGGISQMKLGNGRWETAQFNSRQQVTQLGLGTSATDAGLWKVDYQYGELATDGSGSVQTSKNTGNIAKQTLTIPGTSFSQYYKYDPLYRLTEAKEFTGTSTTNSNWTQTFGYDIYGNRTSFTQSGNGLPTISAPPSVSANTNRFTSSSFAYDKNGNITGDIDPVTSQARSFVFNGDNKQVEVKNASNVPIGKYYYDGEGNRVKKVTDTETTIFVYSSGKLVAEYSTQISTNPTTSYMTSDHLGSPRIITDKVGNVKSRRDFMPFGEDVFAGIGGRTGDTGQTYLSSADDIRQKFTGYQKDNETNLDFAEARMYENRYGRFTAVDPLIASGKSANPQSFNRYVYVGNSPLVATDPSGMIGDYFDRNGNWLGHDHIDDQIVYFATVIDQTANTSYLDKSSIVPTTIEAVWKAQDDYVQLTPGTETEAIQSLATGISDGVDDAITGIPKGIGNAPVVALNGVTWGISNSGFAGLYNQGSNPFAVPLPFAYNNAREASYGSAATTGLLLAPSFVAPVFFAPRTLSVVPDTILSPSQRALTLGAEGERAVGITGPKTRIPSLTNSTKSGYRIPDKLTQTTIEEVKNVRHLNYTKQLKDYHLYSHSQNLQFIIRVRSNTTFSGPLNRLINEGSILAVPIPGL